MRAKFLYPILSVSALLNVICAYDYYREVQNRKFADAFIESTKIKVISEESGEEFLVKKISDFSELSEKKYYFLSIWNVVCGPCIKEMPLLDSLADHINRDDVGYAFVTENGEEMISQFLLRKNIKSKNFTFINDADIYISSILNKYQLKNRQYPIQLIIDKHGDVKYFKAGTVESYKDSAIVNTFNSLK